ncbi:hypothetical protein GCM10022226_74130 [Sphaerisporangium flaviroseum]|uniref:Uncharacterized protein n=1 Tax=Sphaerisporangium flaviroseum TaxID=509199 RepID=A0ABP7JBZ7_9ACTN
MSDKPGREARPHMAIQTAPGDPAGRFSEERKGLNSMNVAAPTGVVASASSAAPDSPAGSPAKPVQSLDNGAAADYDG